MYENLDTTRTAVAILIAILFAVYMHYPNLFNGVFSFQSNKKTPPSTDVTFTVGDNSERPLTIIKGLKQPTA